MVAKKATLALNLPAAAGGGPSLNSCVRLSAEFLKQMPVAFAGTVSAIDAGTVSLDVTHWYVGGTAQVVTLANSTSPTVTTEGGTDFAVGKDYLVSASEGTVSSCGFSGPATPELQQVYTEAFS